MIFFTTEGFGACYALILRCKYTKLLDFTISMLVAIGSHAGFIE